MTQSPELGAVSHVRLPFLRVLVALLCLVPVFALVPAPLSAQEGTATITGRVQNASNGSYLNNAQVSIVGTNRSVLTNQFGEFTLRDVPAGEVRLRVVYTGLDERVITLTTEPGGSVERTIRLSSAGQVADEDSEDMVILDPFVVAESKETNAIAIAANEQRFSANIKSVVAADAFGDVAEGNVGEFIKYLPGVSVDYVAADVRTISVRGFADNFTSVAVDGAQMASAASSGSSRAFELEQVSINSVSRVEVVKVPTPSMPASSLGGSVNLVSKSAFERDRASLSYKAFLSMSDENTRLLSRTPGPGEDHTYKVLPGVEFSYVNPVSDKLGIVVNGISSNQFNEQHRLAPTWRATGAGATPENPYLRSVQLQDGPKNTFRDSLSFKVDYKPADGHVLSATYQVNYYKSFFGNRNINWNVGSSDQPASGGTRALNWSPDFTHGADGRGAVTQGGSFRDKLGATNAGSLKWRFNAREWEIDAGINASKSKNWYRDTSRGHWDVVNTEMINDYRVDFDGIVYPGPKLITVYDEAGTIVDEYDLRNYRLRNSSAGSYTARSRPMDSSDRIDGAHVNIKRSFDAAVRFSLQAGASILRQKRDIVRREDRFQRLGPDGVANSADDMAAPFLDTKYFNVDPGWSKPAVQWASPYFLWDDYRANPDYWVADEVGNYTRRVQNSFELEETITAYYLQAETRLFDSKLQLLAGFRIEETDDDALGGLYNPDAVFLRDGSGDFVLDDNGDRVRRPEAGAPGSIEEARLVRTERGASAEGSYSGLYPSLHATYNITERFLGRFAYARTMGRPNLNFILPSTTIDENEDYVPGDLNAGRVTAANPDLEPWSADNFDVTFEYYGPRGSVFAIGGFYKEVQDFFATEERYMTDADWAAIGMETPPNGDQWLWSRRINAGDATLKGMEVAVSQPLEVFGAWGQHFTLTANGTRMLLGGPNAGDFERFISKTGNFGISYNRSPFNIMLKWNYRGKQRVRPNNIAPDAYEYFDSRTFMDVNIEYALAKNFTLFANARNVLDRPHDLLRYSNAMPEYARLARSETFAVQWTLGVKGTF